MTSIFNQEELVAAGKSLVETASSLKSTKAEFDAAAGPHKAAIAEIKKVFDPKLEEYGERDKILRDAVLAYLEAMRVLRDECIASGRVPPHAPEIPLGLSLRRVAGFEVVDPGTVPEEFWRIDEKAVRAALEANAELDIPGVARTEYDTLVVRTA